MDDKCFLFVVEVTSQRKISMFLCVFDFFSWPNYC